MRQLHRTALFGFACAVVLAVASSTAFAQIRNPGAHPRYGVELEPHLVLQWTDEPYWDDEGIGIGLRGSIPIIDNGPIRTINNSLAISFGLDWAHFGDCGRYDDFCDANDFWFPIVAQWNFWLTKSISLFPEIGLAIQYSTLGWDGDFPNECERVNGVRWCSGDADDLDVEFVTWLGARFLVADGIALTLRLGRPSLTFGVSFFL
jgi:hypothetical protein